MVTDEAAADWRVYMLIVYLYSILFEKYIVYASVWVQVCVSVCVVAEPPQLFAVALQYFSKQLHMQGERDISLPSKTSA